MRTRCHEEDSSPAEAARTDAVPHTQEIAGPKPRLQRGAQWREQHLSSVPGRVVLPTCRSLASPAASPESPTWHNCPTTSFQNHCHPLSLGFPIRTLTRLVPGASECRWKAETLESGRHNARPRDPEQGDLRAFTPPVRPGNSSHVALMALRIT